MKNTIADSIASLLKQPFSVLIVLARDSTMPVMTASVVSEHGRSFFIFLLRPVLPAVG